MAEINFTTINHIARKKLGLSWLEYGLADLIYNLQSNPNSDYPGWCYASKETLADNLDTTKQTIHTLLNKLIEKKLVEKHLVTKHLKITIDWYNTVIIKQGKETLLPVKEVDSDSKETLLTPSKETLLNKDIYNKDNNKGEEERKEKKEFWPSCPLNEKNFLKLKQKFPFNDYSDCPKAGTPSGHNECQECRISIENHRKRGFVEQIKQEFAIHNMLEAGFVFSDMDAVLNKLDSKYGRGNWTLETMAKWLDNEPNNNKAKGVVSAHALTQKYQS